MSLPLTLLNLAGSVALLLWGIHMVQTGVQRDTDHARLREILSFATNMEHAGDVIDKNLLSIGNKMVRRGATFSKSGQAELLAMIARLIVNARTAASLFMTGDERLARQLVNEKDVFRTMESTATDAHFQRLRAGHVETVETSTMHLDALRDLKSVNANLVAATAYPILEKKVSCCRHGCGSKDSSVDRNLHDPAF